MLSGMRFLRRSDTIFLDINYFNHCPFLPQNIRRGNILIDRGNIPGDEVEK